MSLKSKKSFKKFPSDQSEQLDLVETLDDAKKITKKRFSIILFLFLTIGLSFSFILYRQFKNFDLSQFKIPNLSLNPPIAFQAKFSPEIPPNWSVFVETIGTTDFSYSQNYDSSDFAKINTPVNPSNAKKYLPDGVIVSEKINSSPDYSEIFSEISTPKIKFQIYTKIPGKIDSNSSELDVFSRLVSTFYWHLLN